MRARDRGTTTDRRRIHGEAGVRLLMLPGNAINVGNGPSVARVSSVLIYHQLRRADGWVTQL
jgi:hypothetical protein